jgi:hypothetical protein
MLVVEEEAPILLAALLLQELEVRLLEAMVVEMV